VVVIDSPHGPNRYFGGTVSAPIFRRIAEATLRYMGIGQTINPIPAVLVARHDDSVNGATTVPSASIGDHAGSPTVSIVSDGPPHRRHEGRAGRRRPRGDRGRGRAAAD